MIKNPFGLPPIQFKLMQIFTICSYVLLVLVIIPFFLRWFGVLYLPSPDPILLLPTWSHWVIGGVISLPITVFGIMSTYATYADSLIKKAFMCFSMAVILPAMFGYCANLFFGATLPMLHTTLFGEEGHIEYQVRESYDSNSSLYWPECKGLAVETKVIQHSVLCGMRYTRGVDLPLNRPVSVGKGTTIKVLGRKSRAGVFYKSFKVKKKLKSEWIQPS